MKCALRIALRSLLLSILEDESGFREAFKSAVVQSPTSAKVLSKIGMAFVTHTAESDPITKFAVYALKIEIAESAKNCCLCLYVAPVIRFGFVV